MVAEKDDLGIGPVEDNDHGTGSPEDEKMLEQHEVFKKISEGVQFRTVSWQRACVIFLKVIFALGILSIPTAMYNLGAVGGALSLIGWQTLNTCTRGCPTLL